MKGSAGRHGKWLAATLFVALMSMPAVAADYVDVPAGAFQSVLPTADTPLDVSVAALAMRSEPVTNAEFLAFISAHPEWRRDQVPRLFAESRYLEH